MRRAWLHVRQLEWDPAVSESSDGFRPKSSAHQAIARSSKDQDEGDGFEATVEGTPQGPLSPLLANLLPVGLDKKLEQLLRGNLYHQRVGDVGRIHHGGRAMDCHHDLRIGAHLEL
jgi:retron-type reverse transcriptase